MARNVLEKDVETQLNSKEFLLELLNTELEVEVADFLNKYGLENAAYWVPYGDQPSNYSVIGNQSSTAEGGLAERITNGVDALLMKKCMALGIDPEGPEAPKNFKEALHRFWGIENGDLSNASKEIEREFLDDLVIMATSKDRKAWKELSRLEKELAIALYDNGEGQTPNYLPLTILSLLKGNKHKIPFTQGNHNQGGSSSLMYSGRNSYTLVISKRNIEIPSEFDSDDDDSVHLWGWTLIRQELRPNESAPVFTYFAPKGRIPRFDSEELELLPTVLKGNEAKVDLNYDKPSTSAIPYTKKVKSGTFIKHYNYQLNNKGPLVSHFKYALGKRLYDTGLPFNLIDCRKNKFNNVTIFRGLKKILEDDLRAKGDKRLIADGFPDTANFDVEIENQFSGEEKLSQRVEITLYAFNQRDSSKKDESSILDEKPIIFTLGQQIQGSLGGQLLSGIGLSSIRNSLLVVLDFPNIHPAFKKDLFMTDRERLLDKAPRKAIMENLKTYLKNSDKIQNFKEHRIEQSLKKSLSTDSNDLKVIMNKWASDNPNIIKGLLSGNLVIGGKSDGEGDEGQGSGNRPTKPPKPPKPPKPLKEPIDLREEPTYFNPKAMQNEDGIYRKSIYQKKNFKISFETDAPLNYFERMNNPGLIEVTLNGEVLNSNYVMNMSHGLFSLSFTSELTKRVGSQLITIRIYCAQKTFDMTYDFEAIIKKNEKPNEGKGQDKLGLPEYRPIEPDDGYDNVTEETAAFFDGDVVCINIKNKYLQAHLQGLNSESEMKSAESFFIYSMVFSAVSAKVDCQKNSESVDGGDDVLQTIDEDSIVRSDTEAVARTLFINENLSFTIRKGMQ